MTDRDFRKEFHVMEGEYSPAWKTRDDGDTVISMDWIEELLHEIDKLREASQ